MSLNALFAEVEHRSDIQRPFSDAEGPLDIP